MLVLSRRLNEKIVFPESRTVVQVVGVKPGVVRLGVRAPKETPVLRDELPDRGSEWGIESDVDSDAKNGIHPGEPGWLKLTSVSIGLARLQMEAGHTADAQDTLAQIQAQIEALRRRHNDLLAGAPALADTNPG